MELEQQSFSETMTSLGVELSLRIKYDVSYYKQLQSQCFLSVFCHCYLIPNTYGNSSCDRQLFLDVCSKDLTESLFELLPVVNGVNLS